MHGHVNVNSRKYHPVFYTNSNKYLMMPHRLELLIQEQLLYQMMPSVFLDVDQPSW